MNAQTDLKEQKLKQLNAILDRPSQIERWRGIREFLLAYNPKVAAVDREFIQQVNDTRNEQFNDFGSNKGMNIRQLLDMPGYLHEALITADPELLPLMNNEDLNVQRKIWRKLTAAFPEYKVARKI